MNLFFENSLLLAVQGAYVYSSSSVSACHHGSETYQQILNNEERFIRAFHRNARKK